MILGVTAVIYTSVDHAGLEMGKLKKLTKKIHPKKKKPRSYENHVTMLLMLRPRVLLNHKIFLAQMYQ